MTKQSIFFYIENHAKKGEIALYCRVLGVTPQGYRKHLKMKNKPYKYTQLLADMESILKEDIYNSTYGKQRMYQKLVQDYDCPYCYNTVAEVMRENGLLQKKNNPKGLTKADKMAQKEDDLLQRDFTAEAPCEKTVTDITEVPCMDGKLYVSGIFDCFDNYCLGLSLSRNMETDLVIGSYQNALENHDLSGCITHSDRGSQYTSYKFKEFCKENDIIQSMNSAGGRCHDNAKCESMWGRMKVEIFSIFSSKKHTILEMEKIINSYFLDYWNNRRICSANGGLPPAVKREVYALKLMDAAA